MKKHVFDQLLQKYLEGRASSEEEQELFALLDNVMKEGRWDEATMGAKDEVEERMLKRLNHSIDRLEEKAPAKTISLHYWKRMAAAVVLAALGGLLYFNRPNDELIASGGQQPAEHQHDIAPVEGKAVLTLADGSLVVLDSASNGTIAREGGTLIHKTANGQLVYHSQNEKAPAQEALNVISTPSGGSYQITLPDGTKVWLNAGSSLTFPAAFTGRERVVKLRGEAYFEVAKATRGGKPVVFFVETEQSKIKVLGTEFNVMAYANEPAQQTTVIEGSVMVSPSSTAGTPHKGSDRVLKPGQQAVLTNGSTEIQVLAKVNTGSVLAWKTGIFLFDSTPMEHALRQIGRWYNVEVVYQGERPDAKLSGMIPRSSYVSKVLEVLEATGKVKFQIKNNQIIVKKV